VFIEGQRVSAVKQGIAMNIYDAMNNKILDNSYRLDFGQLHFFLASKAPKSINRAMLFGSRPPPNDSLWKMAGAAGFETVIEDRNVANKEKKIDTGIVASMMRHAYTAVDKGSDTMILVAGDKDFVPPVSALVEDDFPVHVVFWDHASQELKDAASRFDSLDPYLDGLRYTKC